MQYMLLKFIELQRINGFEILSISDFEQMIMDNEYFWLGFCASGCYCCFVIIMMLYDKATNENGIVIIILCLLKSTRMNTLAI